MKYFQFSQRIIILSMMLTLIIVIYSNNCISKSPSPIAKSICIYDFENDLMQWKVQQYKDSRAVQKMTSSTKKFKTGKHSLELLLNLNCQIDSLSKGEVFIEVASDTLLGKREPRNMLGKTISCWIHAPYDAVGEWSNRNGIQIFCKDINDKSQYSEWNRIQGDIWFEVKYSPTKQPTMDQLNNGFYHEKGFDPSKIILVGVKIACGGGSNAKYKSTVYLDCVSW